jgi:hypothetical protein
MATSLPAADASDKHSDTGASNKRSARRARVALACQRCKVRKQKCNGERPSCGNCASFDAVCEYIKPTRHHSSRSEDDHLKVAEDRVLELENIIARSGIPDEGKTRWQRLRASPQRSEPSEMREMHRSSKRPHVGCPGSECAVIDLESEGEPVKESENVGNILRDLSLEASGGYIGDASSITFSRMFGSLIKDTEALSHGLHPGEHFSPKTHSEDGADDTSVDITSIPDGIANRLLEGYMKHISTRWPILHSTYIRTLHTSRSSITDPYQKSALHLVYASGGRFLETTGETGPFFCERHHDAGIRHLDEILQYHDIRTIQILILLAIYSLRAPQGPGAWTCIGLAMRTCIDLGMHRKRSSRQYSIIESEMRKRVFWTCYCLDRQISIILGRPFAISDRDIDAELPLDVDESEKAVSALETAQTAAHSVDHEQPPETSTSLSVFIHICRLRRIESQIQHCIYRVDRSGGASEAEVEDFIQQLEDWKGDIPQDARQHSGERPSTSTDRRVIDGYGYYMVYYYKCLRFLLHPSLSASKPNLRFIQKCAEACGGVCQTYKKLHQNIAVGFSLMALHSVFLAGTYSWSMPIRILISKGLTLVYCTWLSPQEVFSITTSNDMNACSIVLYIITERWPGAKRYRDMYEAVKQSVLESIEESKYEPRRAIKRLNTGLFTKIDDNEEGAAEVSRMVADMAGDPMRALLESPCGTDGLDSHKVPGMEESEAMHAPVLHAPMPFQLDATALDFRNEPYRDAFEAYQDMDGINGFHMAGFDMNEF